MTIRVMLADDHCMFRETLQERLSAEPDLEVVAGTGSGAETLEAVARFLPDALVLDIALPDMNGIEVARKLAESHPDLRIVALSGYTEKSFVEEMLKAGALGYVTKSSGARELVSALRSVMAGHGFLSPDVTRVLMRRVNRNPPSPVPPPTLLSSREKDIVRLLCDGMRSHEIAEELGISPATVDVHRRNIKRKLGLKTMAELIRYALHEGLSPP